MSQTEARGLHRPHGWLPLHIGTAHTMATLQLCRNTPGAIPALNIVPCRLFQTGEPRAREVYVQSSSRRRDTRRSVQRNRKSKENRGSQVETETTGVSQRCQAIAPSWLKPPRVNSAHSNPNQMRRIEPGTQIPRASLRMERSVQSISRSRLDRIGVWPFTAAHEEATRVWRCCPRRARAARRRPWLVRALLPPKYRSRVAAQ